MAATCSLLALLASESRPYSLRACSCIALGFSAHRNCPWPLPLRHNKSNSGISQLPWRVSPVVARTHPTGRSDGTCGISIDTNDELWGADVFGPTRHFDWAGTLLGTYSNAPARNPSEVGVPMMGASSSATSPRVSSSIAMQRGHRWEGSFSWMSTPDLRRCGLHWLGLPFPPTSMERPFGMTCGRWTASAATGTTSNCRGGGGRPRGRVWPRIDGHEAGSLGDNGASGCLRYAPFDLQRMDETPSLPGRSWAIIERRLRSNRSCSSTPVLPGHLLSLSLC